MEQIDKDLDLIECYLKGKLPLEERQQFEKRLTQEPALQEALKEHSELINAFTSEKEYWKQLEEEILKIAEESETQSLQSILKKWNDSVK